MEAIQFTCASRRERGGRRHRAYSPSWRRVIAAVVAVGIWIPVIPAVVVAGESSTVQIKKSVRVLAAEPSLDARKVGADSRPLTIPAPVRDGVSRRVTALQQRHAQRQARQRGERRYDLPAPPPKGHVPPRPDAGDVNEYLQQFGGAR